jgi:hypothetical protein
MSRSEQEMDTLEHELGKRGFQRDPRPVECGACGEIARFTYAIKLSTMGGRWIEWCHACQVERSFSRPGGGDHVEDTEFDLEQFLA